MFLIAIPILLQTVMLNTTKMNGIMELNTLMFYIIMVMVPKVSF